MSASRYHDLTALMLGLAVLIADQLTKFWIVQYFGVEGLRPPIPILGDVLTLYYVQNTGVAFSLFAGQNFKFVLIALALGLICYLYWRYRENATLWLRLGFALVLGGAVGNLLDRFARSYVVDFVHFQIPGVFNFAVFNVADSAITIGVVVVALCLYRMGPGAAESGSDAKTAGGANERVSSASGQGAGERR
jgi:signal peptidase II